MIPAEPNPDITLESVVSDLTVTGEIEINATTANLESKFFEHSKRSLELRGIGQDLPPRPVLESAPRLDRGCHSSAPGRERSLYGVV